MFMMSHQSIQKILLLNKLAINMNFLTIIIFILKFIKNIEKKTDLIYCIRKKYGECALNRFRQMERLKKKLIKAQCDTEFIRMCLIYDLTSKFV